MTTCAMKYMAGERRFFVDGIEVDERTYRRAVKAEMRETARAFPKQRGKRFGRPGLFGTDWADWSKENGGRGRYCPQLGRRGKRAAYFTSRHALVEAAKRRGYAVDQND